MKLDSLTTGYSNEVVGMTTKLRVTNKSAANSAALNGGGRTKDLMTGISAGRFDLAFHEFVACSKKKEDSSKDRVFGPLPCETDHIYANVNNNSRNEESLLLTQLDVIQKQREQLNQKDREIHNLRQEKEGLKVRLECMERKVSHLKLNHKRSRQNTLESEINHSSELSGRGSPSRLISVEANISKSKSSSPTKRHFSKELNEDLNTKSSPGSPCRLFSTEANVSKPKSLSPTKKHFLKEADEESNVKSSSPCKTEILEWNSSNPALNSPPRHKNVTDSLPKKPTLSELAPSISTEKTDDVMTTRELYYLPPICLSSEERVIVNPKKENPIEVPRWRYHPVTSCYQLEGTENLDDDVFLKRHLKPEIDEKRRKRWDIQRLREQRHNEKLRRGRLSLQGGHKEEKSQHQNTFMASPEDVQFVEVTESLPVIAFGWPIPKIEPCDFSLDWFSAQDELNRTKKCTKENKSKR